MYPVLESTFRAGYLKNDCSTHCIILLCPQINCKISVDKSLYAILCSERLLFSHYFNDILCVCVYVLMCLLCVYVCLRVCVPSLIYLYMVIPILSLFIHLFIQQNISKGFVVGKILRRPPKTLSLM